MRLIFLIATLAAAACATTPSKPRPPIRVLVYNIHAGKDAAGVDNLDGVAGLVRQTGADLVLLQEVDQGTRRSGNVDQPRVLSERSGSSHEPRDFNSTPESTVQAGLRAGGLRDAWAECGQGPGLTYPADSSIKRIDYLFLTGTLRCASGEVISTRVSDHRPVFLQVVGSP